MKIGKRLNQLSSMVTEHYAHIWDCCCDHGLLGASLAKRYPQSQIHFVDVVPELIETLKEKMTRHLKGQLNWRALCMDAGTLPLGDFTGKQLVIIAGIGGDLMIEMVTRLHNAFPDLDVDFLLCPVHHQYALRSCLIERGFKLKNEQLVLDNQRFYELLLVSTDHTLNSSESTLSHTGSQIWQARDHLEYDICQQYLNKTLVHYQRIQRGRPNGIDAIIIAYQAVNIVDGRYPTGSVMHGPKRPSIAN